MLTYPEQPISLTPLDWGFDIRDHKTIMELRIDPNYSGMKVKFCDRDNNIKIAKGTPYQVAGELRKNGYWVKLMSFCPKCKVYRDAIDVYDVGSCLFCTPATFIEEKGYPCKQCGDMTAEGELSAKGLCSFCDAGINPWAGEVEWDENPSVE